MTETKQVAKGEPVFAVLYRRHGKKVVCFMNGYVPHSVRADRLIGGIHPVERIIDLAPALWDLSFEQLLELWERNELHRTSLEQPVAPEVESEETKAEKRARRLPVLDGIIRTVNNETEREAARRLWKEYTGKDWVA